VKHLGLGHYVLLESPGADGAPIRALAVAAIGHERVVARVDVDHNILAAIESQPEVKVARCSSRGEPSSTYICCEATMLPRDGRKSSEYLLSLSFGFVQRLSNRLKRADYAVLELKPIKAAETSPAKAPSQPPPSASQGPPAPTPPDAA
jgi:hypothetical protein